MNDDPMAIDIISNKCMEFEHRRAFESLILVIELIRVQTKVKMQKLQNIFIRYFFKIKMAFYLDAYN